MTVETFFAELLSITKTENPGYFVDYLRDRVDMVKLCLQVDRFEQLKRAYGIDNLLSSSLNLACVAPPQWQEDTALLLKKMLHGAQPVKTRELMNISEI